MCDSTPRPQRQGGTDCLLKTQDYAKWKHVVYSLIPAPSSVSETWKVNRADYKCNYPSH